MLEEKAFFKAARTGTAPAVTGARTFREIFWSLRYWWLTTWTSLLGPVIGVLPGSGASIAAFVAYQPAQLYSKTHDKFGTGLSEGVVAPESANNGVTTGTARQSNVS